MDGDLVDARTAGLKWSPNPYHESELQVGYQQSVAEAPIVAPSCGLIFDPSLILE